MILKEDIFISNVLGVPTWEVVLPKKVCSKMLTNEKDSFFFVKSKTEDIESLSRLQCLGFQLIDTNLLFEWIPLNQMNPLEIGFEYETRFAKSSDRSEVERIASKSFFYSRFHLDPKIPNRFANEIKKQWVSNFFRGIRGDSMVVSVFQDKAVGFCQIFYQEEKIYIDLIAVDSDHQGKGLAASMIEFIAKENVGSIFRVGTQVSNLPSIRTYQKIGFRILDSHYTLHFHGMQDSLNENSQI